MVVDTIGPIFSSVANITVPATSASGATVPYAAPTAIAEIGAAGPVTCTPASGSVFPVGQTTVTCTAGVSGLTTVTCPGSGSAIPPNQSQTAFVVTVSPPPAPTCTGGTSSAGFAPTFTVPPNITAQATAPSGAVVTFTASATDPVYGALPLTCSPASGSTFPLGMTTVTCIAVDSCGNTASASFTVTVNDTEPPVPTVPPNITAQATAASGAVVTFTGSATDPIYGTAPVTCSPASGSTFAIGATTVTCTATDDSGNTASASFTITVVDTQPPVVTVPANITAQATASSGAVVTFAASATDPVYGTLPVTCSPASGSTFLLGTTTVKCTAIDASGNTSSASFTVTVVDTELPVVTVPANITAQATASSGAVVTFTASASDPVYGTLPVTCTPASGSTFPFGTTTVKCTASDTRGNTASASFTVTVVDTELPVLTLPSTITATATSSKGAVVSYSASATDPVYGSIKPVCTPASGSTFALGTTTVGCTATDAHGNEATGSFKVQVQYAWSGFLAPINANGSSLFKLGSTIPVEFRLTGASAGITNAVATLSWTKVSSTITGTDLETVSSCSASTGDTFRYEGGEYVFNLSTKGLSTGTWSLSINLGDGVTRTVDISLK